MNEAFESFLTWFVTYLPDFLMASPMIYFVAMALVAFVAKIFMILCGRRSRV